MLIQKYKLELTTRIQACIYPDRSRHRKNRLRYLVIGRKQNVLGENWNGPADSI